MTNEPVKANNLSKEFFLGDSLQYYTLRDFIADASKRILNTKTRAREPQSFWALSDVSFKVESGEVLGLIGRNGSGKSTLLKILARIISPTKGSAVINGKVASILEVGTGFHPELSGRENIFLSGAILGMKKREIESKFDEIVEFANIGDFLDTPTKRYSSGMQVRLAFSVASNLDADILLIDEVLAVGDIAFQNKSLQKMHSITKDEGRTVIFVSHSMQAVSSLCSKALLLEGGRVKDFGDTDKIVSRFVAKANMEVPKRTNLAGAGSGNGKIRITQFYATDLNGKRVKVLQTGGSYLLVFKYISADKKAQPNVDFSFAVRTMLDQNLFLHYTSYTGQMLRRSKKEGCFIFEIPKLPLAAGSYKLSYRATVEGQEADHVDQAIMLTVEDGDFYGTGQIISQQHSPIYIEGRWRFE